MKHLVLGSSGQIGYHLVSYLHSIGEKVIEFDIVNNKKPIILVGKGVTYDTGGYIIKDKDSMNNMHLDKLGGCLCLYILEKLIKENTKKSVVVCIPLVENTI